MAEQEQPKPTNEQYLDAILQGMQELRQAQHSQAQQLQEIAAARAQAAEPPKPRVAPGELQSLNERLAREILENPLRYTAEVQAGVKEQTKAEVLAEVRADMERRSQSEQMAQYAAWALAQAQDVPATRHSQVRDFVEWATQNRPDLQGFDQRMQAAIGWTREAIERERQDWQAQAQSNAQARAGAFYPSPAGAGQAPQGAPQLSEEDARRSRLSVVRTRAEAAMRGSYPRAPQVSRVA